MAVELPELVVDVDHADADVDGDQSERAQLQHHVAALQRSVALIVGAHQRRVGEFVAGDQPFGGLPAALGDRFAGRLGREPLAAVVDVPAGGWILQVQRVRVIVDRRRAEPTQTVAHRSGLRVGLLPGRRAPSPRQREPKEIDEAGVDLDPIAVDCACAIFATPSRNEIHMCSWTSLAIPIRWYSRFERRSALLRPGFDREAQRSPPRRVVGTELDLARLEMAVERRQPERLGGSGRSRARGRPRGRASVRRIHRRRRAVRCRRAPE